ncbi:MAG: hypothetical protein A3H42_00990 [Deltaproteobacteria bacterium RIFCSPLOWO2_02_FULL_46_8]|nr:MAG: hypothetical protein A3H42_00990 [Deltaproteobacteria bacterium RIFCSPLOWO2_02_FULL_46_8]
MGGCGGSGGEAITGEGTPISPSVSTSIETIITAKGGIAELSGIAKLEFPESSFSKDAQVHMEFVEDTNELNDYDNVIGGVLEGGGPAYSKVLRIIVPEQPKKDAVIQFTIPEEFSKTLKQQGLSPVLCVKDFWADEIERLDNYYCTFSSFSFKLENNVLSTTLEPHTFTDERQNKPDVYEALVMLGSQKDKELTVKKNFSTSKANSENSSSGFCLGFLMEIKTCAAADLHNGF